MRDFILGQASDELQSASYSQRRHFLLGAFSLGIQRREEEGERREHSHSNTHLLRGTLANAVNSS